MYLYDGSLIRYDCLCDICFPSDLTPQHPDSLVSHKSLIFPFKVTRESTRGQSHEQLPTTAILSRLHTNTQTQSSALKHQTGINFFVFLLHYDFTFLPLSDLTCLSCDRTKVFFRNRWYSDGLGGHGHLISYLLPLLFKTIWLLTLAPPDHHSCDLGPYMERTSSFFLNYVFEDSSYQMWTGFVMHLKLIENICKTEKLKGSNWN